MLGSRNERCGPEFVGVNFAAFFFVEDAEHVSHFSLLFVVADLLAHDCAELFERDVASTCLPRQTPADILYRCKNKFS